MRDEPCTPGLPGDPQWNPSPSSVIGPPFATQARCARRTGTPQGVRPGGVNLIEYNTVNGDWDSRVEVFTPYESDAVWNYEAGVGSARQDGTWC